MEIQKTKKMPNMIQVIIVLGGFLIMAFACNKFGIEIHIALFAGWFLAMAVGKMNGYSYGEMESSVTNGIHEGMGSCLILLAVGALVGTWISGGIVPTVIYYGLKLIHPSIFLTATMILCSLTALATGTSWGSVGTAGIAMMGVGAGLGINPAMTAGAVMGGAYFGDFLSPLSDGVILEAAMTDIDVMDHVKGVMPRAIGGYILAIIAFTAAGFTMNKGTADMSTINDVMNGLATTFHISPLMLVPMVVVVAMLVMRLPSLPVISFGAALGMVCGIVFQGRTPAEAIGSAWAQIPLSTGVDVIDSILTRGGINSMLWSTCIILFGLGFGGLLDKTGLLSAIGQKIYPFIKNGGTLVIASLIVAFLSNLFGSAVYVACILTPKIMGNKFDEMGYSRKVLSSVSIVGALTTVGMIPWSDNGVYMSTVLGVDTFTYTPFLWFNIAVIIVTVIYGFTGKFMWDNKNDVLLSQKNEQIEQAE